MRTPYCPREHEVVAAILSGRWPAQCEESLHVHVTHCEVCRGLVEVVGLLQVDRDALHGVSVPGAGQVWWRAAIRARVEASQQVARPLSWLFGVAVACAAGLAITAIELLWSPIQVVLMWVRSSAWIPSLALSDMGIWLSQLTPLAQTGAFVLLGATACLVFAPLALYFALSDE